MVRKVADVQHIVQTGITNPRQAFPAIKALAQSDDWAEREVAATTLVEISKKKPDEVVAEMLIWSKDRNPNVRRTSSEGLRDVARKRAVQVLPVLENLNTDANLYVRKSVANVLRNASNYDPDLVLDLCRKWATRGDPNTNWIIKDGLRKLKKTRPTEVETIVGSLRAITAA